MMIPCRVFSNEGVMGGTRPRVDLLPSIGEGSSVIPTSFRERQSLTRSDGILILFLQHR